MINLHDLKKLADLAPPKTDHPPGPGEEYSPPVNAFLDVSKYLTAHGVVFRKETGSQGQPIWKVERCFLNPDHGPWESWIGQFSSGAVYYRCFHNSCPTGRPAWDAVRSAISGQKKLTPWMQGLDLPARRSPGTAKNKTGESATGAIDLLERAGVSLADDVFLSPISVAETRLPSPQEMKPEVFFEGKAFNPVRLSNYIARYLAPLICTAKQFYRFTATGFWEQIEDPEIEKLASIALGARDHPAKSAAAMQILRCRTTRPEKFWTHHSDGSERTERKNFLCCKNGMISIKALLHGDIQNALIPHDKKYFARYQIAANFNSDADLNSWQRVLNGIFPNTPAKIQLIREACGYALWPSCRFNRIFIFQGDGSNGKTLLLDALRSVAGEENVTSLSLSDLSEKHRCHVLNNVLINLSSESPSQKMVDTESLKIASEGLPMLGEPKFKDPFFFRPFATHFFSCNEMPKIYDPTHAFARRVSFVKFRQRFEGGNKDRSIKATKIHEWRDSIFYWALGGLASLLDRNEFFNDSGGVIEQETGEFIMRLNPIKQYCSERLDQTENDAAFEYTTEIYRNYSKFCDDNGHKKKTSGKMAEGIEQHFRKARWTRHPNPKNRRSIITNVRIVIDIDQIG